MNVHDPDTASACDNDAGPPVPQSNLTMPIEATLEKVKCPASNCNEAIDT